MNNPTLLKAQITDVKFGEDVKVVEPGNPAKFIRSFNSK
jgi:hypothetical protein